jgi:hypothetical protein
MYYKFFIRTLFDRFAETKQQVCSMCDLPHPRTQQSHLVVHRILWCTLQLSRIIYPIYLCRFAM